MNSNTISRRAAVKSSIFGLLAVSIPSISYSKNIFTLSREHINTENLFHRYPSIDDAIVNEVVGKSHFDIETVKKLVDKQPELARANWDWSFGDWESAIGAASHVGRRDIIVYLLGKGARANLFTLSALGKFEAVKTIIEAIPNIQETQGPHGISLLQHAKAGLRMKDEMSSNEIESSEKLIDYLNKLGNATSSNYEKLLDGEKEKYLGDYKYGEGANDGFSVKLNMRKMISLGKLGKFGGGLNKIGEHKFLYNGVSSVTISFQVENNVVKSLTVQEPDLTLVAKKL